MLARLWHDRIVRSDDQDREVDARGPGQHVLDEPLMAWHIDDAETVFAQVEARKADVYSNAPLFFLRQPIAINACERLDERGLAVIDVPGSAEDEVGWHFV